MTPMYRNLQQDTNMPEMPRRMSIPNSNRHGTTRTAQCHDARRVKANQPHETLGANSRIPHIVPRTCTTTQATTSRQHHHVMPSKASSRSPSFRKKKEGSDLENQSCKPSGQVVHAGQRMGVVFPQPAGKGSEGREVQGACQVCSITTGAVAVKSGLSCKPL